ncbi:MAG TPA: hypothetical protein PKD00_11000 [Burkholderiales bacterium]|nr:hypothetical protein [Burkholderiales bacterium]
MYKTGASTGTKIKIAYVDAYIETSVGAYAYKPQIKLKPLAQYTNTCQACTSLGGDSGSTILIGVSGKLKVLGILFAGTLAFTETVPPSAIVSPIWKLSSALGIEPWDGNIIVDSDADYLQINKNERKYEKVGPTNLAITHTVSAFTEYDQNIIPTC